MHTDKHGLKIYRCDASCLFRVHLCSSVVSKSIFGQIERLQFQFAGRIFFQLLDFYFRFRQFFLAHFHQPRAFLIFGEQGFERQIIGFHRLDHALKLFEGVFKGQALGGIDWPRAFRRIWHANRVKGKRPSVQFGEQVF